MDRLTRWRRHWCVASDGGRITGLRGTALDPSAMWQFAEVVRGLTDGCAALGAPVTGSNVSFYNSTGAMAIYPTTIVGVLGVLDDVAQRVPSGWRASGLALLLLGETHEELGGSAWAWVEHGHLGGFPPAVDLEAERQLADVLVGASAERPLDGAAHDVSDCGLAQAPVDGVLRYGTGARVALTLDLDPFVALFSESAARAVVAMRAGTELRVRELCEATGVPYPAIGTTGRDALPVGDLFDVRLDELRAMHEATLPVAFE
jgi:phosphoribosylformylglycinamidine (FGAM) synthase-like enzyme